MKKKRMSPITLGNETLYRQEVEKCLAGMDADTFVDLGAGDGVYTLKLGKILGAKKIIGVEYDEDSLTSLKKRKISAVKADLNISIPIEDNTAAVVVANQVVEHIARTDTFMKETHRILKPGGTAILCTPNLASWHNIAALIMGWQPFAMQVSDEMFVGNPKHPNHLEIIEEDQADLRVFTHFSLAKLAKIHGFIVHKKIGVGFYPFKGTVANILSRLDRRHSAYILLVLRKKA